ncbi:coiled-coil domain-containing protein 124 [Xyrichtys novacula]|uniref:Coiled-coil domain-containing protein 124 n=1 Tax=Xyrichtys novacula TaxID=13765 RepID=A0AAV1FI94_XYRNO|nr:coiled-coil domain-containing protein 124 [Xyrichtys novacula]
MPKKFQGENSKAATARARKAEAKAVADARKKQQEEDALWQETDKHVLKKEQRKRLLDEENARMKGKAQKEAAAAAAAAGGKVTRAQIEEMLLNEQQQAAQEQLKPKEKSHLDTPLEENVNRIIPEEGTVEARTIEDAIAVLSTGPEDLDHHPERRMKAAFAAFEEANMPRLKQENPNMRLSQLKQQLKKEWMKAPENPLNQRFTAYNTK